jgi:hypothetical protein
MCSCPIPPSPSREGTPLLPISASPPGAMDSAAWRSLACFLVSHGSRRQGKHSDDWRLCPANSQIGTICFGMSLIAGLCAARLYPMAVCLRIKNMPFCRHFPFTLRLACLPYPVDCHSENEDFIRHAMSNFAIGHDSRSYESKASIRGVFRLSDKHTIDFGRKKMQKKASTDQYPRGP